MCRTSAFTLLETMIALGVLTFAVTGLLMTLETSVDAAKVLRWEAGVRHELENRLARLRVDARKEFRQEFPPDEKGVTYVEEIVPERVIKSDHTVLEGYRRIQVTAKWQGGDREVEEREASFLIFVP